MTSKLIEQLIHRLTLSLARLTLAAIGADGASRSSHCADNSHS